MKIPAEDSASSIELNVAGAVVRFGGTGEQAIGQVRENFQAFLAEAQRTEGGVPTGSDLPDTLEVVCETDGSDHLARWEFGAGNGEQKQMRSGTVRVSTPEFFYGAFHILLHRFLAARSGFLILHANALYNVQNGQVLLLAGASGAGKSTLTRKLLEQLNGSYDGVVFSDAPDWKLLAEDAVIFSQINGGIWPYPRAAGLREFDLAFFRQHKMAAEPATRKGFGTADEKQIAAYPEGIRCDDVHRAVTPSKVFTLLLGFDEATISEQTASEKSTSVQTTVFLSQSADHLQEELNANGLPVVSFSEEVGVHRLVFDGEFDGEQIKRLCETAERQHALVLSIDRHDALQSLGRKRPDEPHLQSLDTAQALPLLLPTVRRPHLLDRPTTPGGLMMQLTRVLSQANFYRCVPGGTPDESAAFICRELLPG
jgi:energy-coupling factor transporter ATP-binding protein EcfA2